MGYSGFVRKGDTLVVWKLERLARSLKQLIETVELLAGRAIGLRSLTESIDTTTAGGKLLADPAITVQEAARRLKVAPSTLYRHLPGGRGALMDGGLA
jgi:DNA invertase Pin-like site-specific DNA recombinase